VSAIRFEGDREFSLPVETVASRLGDAAFLISCLDKVDHIELASADRGIWKQKTGFTFLSATLDVDLTVVERTPTLVKYRAESKGVGATSVVGASLQFSPTETGTRVHYEAEVVKRTGVLKIVSAGLIQSAAKSVIEETWTGIGNKLMTS
jgi:carbon monoxide dehydrogenase subunit G